MQPQPQPQPHQQEYKEAFQLIQSVHFDRKSKSILSKVIKRRSVDLSIHVQSGVGVDSID